MHNFLRLYDGYINGISAPNRNEQNNLTKNKLCNIQTQFDLTKNKLCNTQIDLKKTFVFRSPTKCPFQMMFFNWP